MRYALSRAVLSCALLVPHLGSAAPVQRQVRFASVLGHSVINEVRAQDVFFFERCAYHHVEGLNVLAELQAHAFVSCRQLGVAQPLSARAGVLKTLDQSFSARRKELADPNVVVWALQGGLEGLAIGGLGYVAFRRLLWPRGYGMERAVRDFARIGGLAGLATAYTRGSRAVKRRGKNQALLDLFDPSMPSNVYLLDARTDDKLTQMKTMDAIAGVIDSVMEAYVP